MSIWADCYERAVVTARQVFLFEGLLQSRRQSLLLSRQPCSLLAVGHFFEKEVGAFN